MAVKTNALQIIEDNRLVNREAAQDRTEEQARRHRQRLDMLLRRLLSGEPLTAEDGRELFYDFICNGEIMRKRSMTGNAMTYFILGKKEWAEDMAAFTKDLSIDLFHKMEKEYVSRRKREVE